VTKERDGLYINEGFGSYVTRLGPVDSEQIANAVIRERKGIFKKAVQRARAAAMRRPVH
jgi:hypothetical protein